MHALFLLCSTSSTTSTASPHPINDVYTLDNHASNSRPKYFVKMNIARIYRQYEPNVSVLQAGTLLENCFKISPRYRLLTRKLLYFIRESLIVAIQLWKMRWFILLLLRKRNFIISGFRTTDTLVISMICDFSKKQIVIINHVGHKSSNEMPHRNKFVLS